MCNANQSTMGESILVLVLKLASVDEDRNRLGIEDYAVLQCVSKSVAKEAKDITDCKECMQKAWMNTAFFLGYDSDFAMRSLGLTCSTHCLGGKSDKTATSSTTSNTSKTSNELVVDGMIVLKTFIKTRRLLFTLESDETSKHKLVSLLNELTSKIAHDTFSPSWEWSIGSQTKTISSLINLHSSRCIELRVLGMFFTFYFISLILKDKRLKTTCILANQGFRETAIAQSFRLRADLRNQITMLPFGFTEKFIRTLTFINGNLQKW